MPSSSPHTPSPLRLARQARGWSQRQVAQAVGTNPFTVTRWEQGRAFPSPHFRQQLSELFGMPVEALGLLPRGPATPGPAAALWQVPFPRNPFFTGRETLLAHLHTLLSQEQAGARIQPYALSGLGGIGKTQVALEYVYRYARNYVAVFWIGAETEQTLLTDVAALAGLLDLPECREAEQPRLQAAFTRWLADHHNWLLILDNLEEGALLQRLVPPTRPGAVLVTTRRQALGALAQPLAVDRLSTEEGVQLLLGRAWRLRAGQEEITKEEEALARHLTEALEGLPLALDQAGAYLEETGCSLATYLHLYQQAPLRLLDERGADGTHPASVVRTFGLACVHLAQRDLGAMALVQACAYLAPEAIPEAVFTQEAAALEPELAPLLTDPFQYQAAVKSVLASGLLRRQAQAGTFTMHRLVQAVVREQMEKGGQRQWAERVVRLVAAAFPDPLDYPTTWAQCQRLLPHALACVDYIERWRFTSSASAHLLQEVGTYLRLRAQHKAAEPLLERALAIREQALGPEHPDVAASVHALATLSHEQGRYPEARLLYQRALSIRERVFGPAHSQVAQSLNNLAFLCYAQGQYQEALRLQQQALAIREQTLGEEHPSVATSLVNVAFLHLDLGNYAPTPSLAQQHYAQAIPLAQRAVAIHERTLDPTHPDLAASLTILAALHRTQGRYAEALRLHHQALASREQILGPDHPDLTDNLNGLVRLYQDQGQDQEAVPLAQRALSIRERVLGPDHPQVAYALNTLAQLYRHQGRHQEALPLAQRALALLEQALEPEHPDLAITRSLLADLLEDLGLREQARSLAARTQTIHAKHRPIP